MRNLNDVTLSGHLSRNMVVREVMNSKGETTKYVDGTLASNRSPRKIGENKWDKRADFIPVSFVGKTAEKVDDLKKGDFVVVNGSIESYNYEKEDGTAVYGIRVHVKEIINIRKAETETTETETAE